MRKTYFTLAVRVPDGLWTPQFGDYDRDVVLDEQLDTEEDWPKRSKFKIIRTYDSQADVMMGIAKLNRKDGDRVPVNPVAHVLLTDQGAATLVEKGDADFDDGDPENGPGYGGHPDYDRYYADEMDICITWQGLFASPVELDPPDFP